MPMTRIRTITLAAAVAASAQLVADEMDFPEILDAGIPGSPKLGQPFLVTGGSNPILTEKHGLRCAGALGLERRRQEQPGGGRLE